MEVADAEDGRSGSVAMECEKAAAVATRVGSDHKGWQQSRIRFGW